MTPMIDHECNWDFYQTPVAATHKRAEILSECLWLVVAPFVQLVVA